MNRDEVELLKQIAELAAEISGLRAENKCLREDRDSWKEYAMRAVPPMPTVAPQLPAPSVQLCGCAPGTVCMNAACPHRAIIS